MLFMIVSRTRTDLASEDYGRLAAMARAFYADLPPGVSVRSEWTAQSGGKNFALLEAPDEATVQRLQAPFRPYVDIEIVEVVERQGWTLG
jgi:hypothetical protein